MARIQKPPPAKLIVSIIYSSMDALAECISNLEKKFGRVMSETLEIKCEQEAKYREEMGENLVRRFYAFEADIPRDALPQIKSICHKLEPDFSDTIDDYHFRTVNIDPGILTPSALVMASHKEAGHKIYLKDGVFAEVSMIYAHGGFYRLPWTNSDFCDDEAIQFFEEVRNSFDILEPVEG